MLSIVSIKTSSISNKYYLTQDGNYHIEDIQDKNLYEWVGKGAKILGLHGQVKESDYTAIFNGKLPGGIQIGKISENGIKAGRPGYDLTFSLNKDISLIICCSRDQNLSDYFLQAHIQAVKTTMKEVEKMTSARITTSGETQYIATQNITAALCTHFSSRAGDPQVHTHACVANATCRPDGKWRALSTDMTRQHGFYEKIRDHATYLGHIYQNEMALATKQIGFDIMPVNKHGMFAIKGFPDEIKSHFSKRRNQIESIIEGFDNPSKKLIDKVTQHSKMAKEKIGQKDFLNQAKKEMDQYIQSQNLSTFDKIVDTLSKGSIASKPYNDPSIYEIIKDSIDILSQYSIKIEPNKILEQAILLGMGDHQLYAYQDTIDRLIDTGYIERTSSGHLTSSHLQAQENEFKKYIAKSQNRIEIHREPRSLENKLEAIGDLIEKHENHGRRVTVLSQSKSFTSRHNEHLRSLHQGFWQKLRAKCTEDQVKHLHSFLHQYPKNLVNRIPTSCSKEVYIVHDAQRLSLQSCQDLIKITEKRQAKLIFTQFDEGRRAALVGNPMDIIERSGIKPKDTKVKTRTASAKIAIYGTEVKLNDTKSMTKARRHQALTSDLVRQYGSSLEHVQVIATCLRDVNQLNQMIRNDLKINGHIACKEYEVEIEKKVYLSDKERHYANYYPLGGIIRTHIRRGVHQEQQIIGIDKENNKILTKSIWGGSRRLDPKKVDKNSQIYKTEKLAVSDGDRISLNNETKISKSLGISITDQYSVKINKKKIALIPDNRKNTEIKIDIDQLRNLDISHAYAQKNTKDLLKSRAIFLDAPSYQLSSRLIADITRNCDNIDIYTDNENKAKSNMAIRSDISLPSEILKKDDKTHKNPPQLAIDYALSMLNSREAAFSYQSVLDNALSYPLEKVGIRALKSALKDRIRLGEITYRRDIDGSVLLATQHTIDIERRIIDQIIEGKNTVTPFMNSSDITHALSTSTLTLGQKSACELLATSTDRFVMVQGYAGTGKSTMLQTLKQSLEQHGCLDSSNIIALAPTHKAVKELHDKGMSAQTLKSFLVEKRHQLDNKLILLDESSMVSNQDFINLQTLIENSNNARCAYIGDIAQLSPVEAGKPSELAYIAKEANIGTAIMDEIIRQKNPILKKVASDLIRNSEGGVKDAFSTLDKMQAINESEEPLIALSKAYAKLTPDERDQTLIAIATNKNRDLANILIRQELKDQGIISSSELNAVFLQDSRLTDAELTVASHYKLGDMIKLNNDRWYVNQVDNVHHLVYLRNNNKQSYVLNTKMSSDNRHIELFKCIEKPISVGDYLKWTKSDKDRGIIAHSNIHVTNIDRDNKVIQVTDHQGQPQSIDLKIEENQHLDYAYTSTVHGLQGATSKRVMVLLDSKNNRSNNRRLMYVAGTRATDEAVIFTDNRKEVERQITQKSGIKYSALEALDLLEKKNKTDKTQPAVKQISHIKIPKHDAKLIEQSLRNNARAICQQILGDPNKSLSNASNLRYGRKGSLSIKIQGQHQGSFHNFETGAKGGMIQLIMDEMDVDFKTALEQGAMLLGGSYACIKPDQKEKSAYKVRHNKQTICHIIKQSVPIKGTLAEKYLNSRAIEMTDNCDLRFIKKIKTGKGNMEKKAFSSAMISIARNDQGVPQAIQLTYLDPNSGKRLKDLPIQKRSHGQISGRFVNLSTDIKTPDITYVAEGVETALSVKQMAIQSGHKNIQVLASLGKENLRQILHIKTANKVVLALDNDGVDWQQDQKILDIKRMIESQDRVVECMQPAMVGGKKTDFNDIKSVKTKHLFK